MGRPRLTEQRGEQILDAFIALVGENGLHATTLDDVADAVDLRRGTVRHFVGNRQQLIVRAIDRLVTRDEAAFRTAIDGADGAGDEGAGSEKVGSEGAGAIAADVIDRLLDRLFTADAEMGTEDRAFVALANAGDDPAIRRGLALAYERYLQLIDEVLADATDAPTEARWEAALAILSLAETANLLLELGFDPDVRARAARAAHTLVRALDEGQRASATTPRSSTDSAGPGGDRI